MPASGILFIISAPSGTGKNTIVEVFLNLYPDLNMSRFITYTTKKPRLGDVQGKDYHFISVHEFEQKIQEGFFLEYSLAYGNYYGSAASMITRLEQGSSFFLIIDRDGADRIAQLYKHHILIWVTPPSLQELEARLIKRAGEAPEDIKKRLMLASIEIELEQATPLYKYHITNEHINESVSQLYSIVSLYVLGHNLES